MRNRAYLSLFALFIASILSGCMMGGLPINNLANMTVTDNINAPLDVVLAAARSAFADEGLRVKEIADERGGGGGRVRFESQFSDGTNISVSVTPLSRNLTELAVKVGTMGDQERSKWIMRGIAHRVSVQMQGG